MVNDGRIVITFTPGSYVFYMIHFKNLCLWVFFPHNGGSNAEGMRKLGGSKGKMHVHHRGGSKAEGMRKLLRKKKGNTNSP